MVESAKPARRWLFTLTILTSSFLLFLVQPMVARMALPQLGGAPAVWNSAMLVYQALLLGGYAYAHWLSRFAVPRQAAIHLLLLLLAALSLPIALRDIGAAAPGWEALWVPWLFLLSVGPAFVVVSAQAPLIQRWFAANPSAGDPYPLYAASNLGSFAGLLAYPLLAEPLFELRTQSAFWAAGYGVLVLLVAGCSLTRQSDTVPLARESAEAGQEGGQERGPSRKTLGLWLILSAVPSGLMLSTTTYLTTDIMAMPLLWVIPLGLYLLSFTIAFAHNRALAGFITLIAPILLLVDGSAAMFNAGREGLVAAIASVILLFAVAVALHARLYDLRPPAAQLTRFYLFTSAGGAIGGLFTALFAPLVFDWTWEHPLLILAAAMLLPLGPWATMLRRLTDNPNIARLALALSLFCVFMGAIWLYRETVRQSLDSWTELAAFIAMIGFAMLLAARRWAFVASTAALLLALGGFGLLQTSLAGHRERSYFGIYKVDHRDDRVILTHGTTVHGVQRSGEREAREPTAYYGPRSGIGLALRASERLYGSQARIGVVGLGVGTLACYRQPGQRWTFFEIDPVVHEFSLRGDFTFLERCAPEAPVIFGDARLELDALPEDRFDMLAIDAFSSDAIPLHLLTSEALALYFRVLEDDGLLLMHISNRYVGLEPVLARLAQERGLAAVVRHDSPEDDRFRFASSWVALARDSDKLAELREGGGWEPLAEPEGAVWTDEYASILPYLRWENFL